MKEDILFCWSGGKDSAMALHALQLAQEHRICALLTTVSDEFDRISMLGVRRALLERQAESIGLPLHAVLIPPQCVNATYEARMKEALGEYLARGVRQVGFGDIFLEDLRVYREKNLARVGMSAMFPIWKRDTRELARDFCAARLSRDYRMCRSTSARSVIRRARAGRIFLCRPAAGRRSLRREWRIPHVCF